MACQSCAERRKKLKEEAKKLLRKVKNARR